MLHVDAVGGDARERDVAVYNVLNLEAYSAGFSRVGLDAATVLAIGDSLLRERHSVNGVIALAAYRADAQPVAAGARHACDKNVCAASDSDAVVLVVDLGVLERQIRGGGDIEAVQVVSGGQAPTSRVCGVSG